MFKNYLIVLLCVFSLLACSKLDKAINISGIISEQQNIDARMLYRGLMYGNEKQIKQHVDVSFFEKIKNVPQFLVDTKYFIPKSEPTEIELISENRNINIPKFWEKRLIVTYIYHYELKKIVYVVVFDEKTKKIIDVTISEALL